MIFSYGDSETEAFHSTGKSKRLAQDILKTAAKRLDVLEAATDLGDLTSPGNKLEALKGDWKGYHSIRINRQWRVVFRWDNGAHDVSIVDYH